MASGGPVAELLRAVVIGGTGATGRCLVGELLKEKEKVGKVTVIGRRKVESVADEYGVDIAAEESSGRLVQHAEDLDDVSDETVKQLCTGSHVFFNCMGTSRARAGSADAFRHIDYEIPVRLIKLSHQAGVPHCSVVTSVGANPNSWFLYLNTKGRMEEAVRSMEFKNTSIFRPGGLDRGNERRFGEKLISIFTRLMPVGTVAQAMLQDALSYHESNSTRSESQTEAEEKDSEKPFFIYKNADIYRLQQELNSK